MSSNTKVVNRLNPSEEVTMIGLLALLVFLNVMDYLFTVYNLKHGFAYEANPVMARVVTSTGYVGLGCAKMSLTMVGAVASWFGRHYWWCLGLVSFIVTTYVVVVAWNVGIAFAGVLGYL